MQKRFCDLCGAEIDEYTSNYLKVKMTNYNKGNVSPYCDTDWCENCFKALFALEKTIRETEDSTKVVIGIKDDRQTTRTF